jgi:hypothetical protein
MRDSAPARSNGPTAAYALASPVNIVVRQTGEQSLVAIAV